MWRTITLTIIMLLSICGYAQTDVTQFLGIPVDGSKSEMVSKLKAKGFHPNTYSNDMLDGKFNGMDVHVQIVTNGDKVCRIAVFDANSVDERSIQIRFNTLIRQFQKNPKYASSDNNALIPDDEDILYEMIVNKKRYQAVFYQNPIEVSDTAWQQKMFQEKIKPLIESKYSPEELANHTDAIKEECMKMCMEYLMELWSKKTVWFMISDHLGKYYITMFYDNEYNRANGEDL